MVFVYNKPVNFASTNLEERQQSDFHFLVVALHDLDITSEVFTLLLELDLK